MGVVINRHVQQYIIYGLRHVPVYTYNMDVKLFPIKGVEFTH